MMRRTTDFLIASLAGVGCLLGSGLTLSAANSMVTGSVRIQLLSSSAVRLEAAGPEGYEDRPTFHIRNRNWPGTAFSSNVVSGQMVIQTAGYTVSVPLNATSLAGASVTSPTGQVLFQYAGTLTNHVWLPGPSEHPGILSFADTPRLIPPSWGIAPAPAGAPWAATCGWDTNNDAPDIYVLVPGGSYEQMRQDFLQLTGPAEMVPLYALGAFDSRWYDYSESTALAQIDNYRSRSIPLDVLVCDTGWRQGASTGYLPNTNLFPNLARFFEEAHAKNVRLMFNDHPEPVASNALDPAEVTYRYTNLTQLLGEGLNVWWYDRNWSISLLSPSPNLRHEVWGLRVCRDATLGTNPALRPMIMANVDGIDNGIRNNPMDVAAHTFPIQWTGDIQPALTYLNYAVANAVHSGVQSLFPYESDDLGGHVADPPPGDFIRWIEYGALSPVYRPHCTYDLSRMPWTFGPEAEWVARRMVDLRYRLLPEFYAAARLNYDTGEPIVRRLDLDYPQYPQASGEGEYLIGHSLLVAPITQGGLTTVPATWLTTASGQPGLEGDYFANTNLVGSPAFTEVDPNIAFNWNSGSPGGTVPASNFSVRWTGTITVPAAVGDVVLAAQSDDGVRVYVDNQLCLGNWGPNNAVTTESTTVLKAGQTHQLEVDYLQMGGNDLVALQWRPAAVSQSVWIPPGNWIDGWNGAVLNGPATISYRAPLDRIPMFIRSGAVFVLAPEMPYTGQSPWNPVTVDAFPSTTETDQTSLYEDDGLTIAYQQGQCRWTPITTSADDGAKTVSVVIGAAAGSFTNAPAQRSWVVRIHRPPSWSDDWAPGSVMVNGQPSGAVIRRVKNASAMPFGADNGAPDADSFELTLPDSSVLASNSVVATFQSSASPWTCADVGAVGAAGNVFGGFALGSNSVWIVLGGGAGLGGTNDGFHFLSQPVSGSTQISARLVSQSGVGAGAEAGLLMTEGVDPAARCVALGLAANNEVVFQSRATIGMASQTTRASGFSPPCWLRLVRNGSTFFGYASDNGGVQWTQIGSATIPGFNFQAFVGAAVTAATSTNTVPATNSFGTVIAGVCPEMLGGTSSTDDTNYNLAVFDHLTLTGSLTMSTIPNQAIVQSGATPAIPFWGSSSGGGPLTFTVQSSNTNLLPVQGITIGGAGTNRSVMLSPNSGASGTSVVTVTVSDGTNSASTQFTVTRYAAATASPGSVLLSDNFTNYTVGHLPGQPFQGTGFAAGAAWVGLDSTFATHVSDAATVSSAELGSALFSIIGGTVTVKGDGSNLEGVPDLSSDGPFAAAGLYDPASNTIGGGNVNGTLYLSFFIRAHFNSGENAYGGLQLSRGNDTSGVLIGNSAPAWAFSLWYPATSTSVDLDRDNGSGGYCMVDTSTHLMVARVQYLAGADDTLTAWLDPNPGADENTQNSAATYVGSVSGDLSFDRFFLRGGYSGKQFDYGRICLGTSWSAVLPPVVPVSLPAPVFQGTNWAADGRFNLTFSGPAGQSYSVHVSTNLNLARANWPVVNTGTFGFAPVSLADSPSAAEVQRFYFVSIP